MALLDSFFKPRLPPTGLRLTETAPPAGEQAFDYILSSLADLIAVTGPPVADVYTLPSGSYAIKAGFSLANDAESLFIPITSSVLWVTMGPGKTVTAGSGLVVAGLLTAYGMRLQSVGAPSALVTAGAGKAVLNAGIITGDTGPAISAGDGQTIEATDCDIKNTGNSPTVATQTGSKVTVIGGSVTNQAGGSAASFGGELRSFGTRWVTQATVVPALSAGNDSQFDFAGCYIEAQDLAQCLIAGTDSRGRIAGCDLHNPTPNVAGSLLDINSNESIQVVGNRLRCTGGEAGFGIRFGANQAGLCTIADNVVTEVQIGVGTLGPIPTSLTLMGNVLDSSFSPIAGAGFVPSAAGVFMRANIGAGGAKASETAIV